MPPHPLTHHDIVALVEPFARRGRHVDLAASDRLERRVVFKPVERAQDGCATTESLELLQRPSGTYRLCRAAARAGIAARLWIEGPEPAQLLERIESLPPRDQFVSAPGYAVAFDHRLAADAGRALILERANARIGALTLELRAPEVRGEPAALVLRCTGAEPPPLPADVLAVLGRCWSPLRWSGDCWRGEVRLKGREPDRSRRAEQRFTAAVAHLALTLTEPPGRFHDRWAAARWRVYLRRAVPLLACAGLIAGAAALPRAHLSEHSALRMLVFNLPPLLMAMFFCLREIPRIEIPPLPRRSDAPSWASAAWGAAR